MSGAAGKQEAFDELSDWLVRQGLHGLGTDALLEGYCLRLLDAGVPLFRVHLSHRAHHPEYGGIGFDWYRDSSVESARYDREGERRDLWTQSTLYHLLEIDERDLRIRLSPSDPPTRFAFLEELRTRGATDYFATKLLFGAPRNSLAVDPDDIPEGMMVSWTANGRDGFSDDDIDGLRRVMPSLGLALRAGSNRQMAEDLASVYLGADAGRRVLSGDITRGSFETIRAVIWLFDLRGFTRLSEVLPGAQVIEMLNTYFGAVVDIVEARGGNVLKFMGDAVLAIFAQDDLLDAGRAALGATDDLRHAFATINAQREADGLPCTGFTLAMHAGDVHYGNIGGRSRLDFTVIGPAVNTTARVHAMCSHVDQTILMSSAVARPLLAQRRDIVSLGQYRLRGVGERQELFTLD